MTASTAVSSSPPNGCVVVGVDGSRAGLNAVAWAVAESVDRDVTLRLVHAVTGVPARNEVDAVLARARDAALQGSESVRIQVVHATGDPGDVLVGESRRASLVCVGAGPRGYDEAPVVGPTAAGLARRAACPVAVIRSRRDGTPRTDGVIAVVLSDEPANDIVVRAAMHEGRLRGATVRQIDERVDSWVRRFPDVHVEIVAGGTGPRCTRECAEIDPRVGLAVVGAHDAEALATLTMPNSHSIHGFPDCSVLVVRG